MILILEILGGFVAMLAAGIAIVGDTWDKHKEGLQRITKTGKWVIFIAIFGFCISMTSSVMSYVDYVKRQKAAISEIDKAWVILMEPFKLFLWELDGKQSTPSVQMIDKIISEDYLNKINNTIDLRGEAPHHYGKWLGLICKSTQVGLTNLRQSQTIYVGILDTELITLTKDVAQSTAAEFMRILSPCDTVNYPGTFKLQLQSLANLDEIKRYLITLKKLKIGMIEYM